jgi:aminoglycoside 6'-N-acetyltransferase I
MTIEIRLLGPGDDGILQRVAPDVFDHAVQSEWAHEFLNDHRHHIVVAIDGGMVVGFASAVHYLHPDKSPELWINEVGVAPSHRNGGIGKSLLHAMLEVGRQFGCREAWVLTDRNNPAAMRLYSAVGGVEFSPDSVMFNFPLPGDNE